MLQFLLIIPICASVPLALWMAYRLGRKVCELEWQEAIEWSDDPQSVRHAVHTARRRMNQYDEGLYDE